MRYVFLRLSAALDRLARAVCTVSALILLATVLGNVVARYGFGTGSIAFQDLAGYAFAVFLIFSIPVCMAQGGHVRVEVLSERLPVSYLRRVDLLALVAFLIPTFGLLVWAWWPTLSYSWSIREASVETGGLPGLFLVKTALPVAALLMIVQGIAAVLCPSGAARD